MRAARAGAARAHRAALGLRRPRPPRRSDLRLAAAITLREAPDGATGVTLVHERLDDLREALPDIAAGVGPGYLSEQQALSAFALEDGVVYHTYSTYARGAEIMMGFYPLLDRAPKGRNES